MANVSLTPEMLGTILALKQQIEAGTALKPSGVQLPYRFGFMTTPEGGLSSVTELFGLPVTYGGNAALLYAIDLAE